MAKAASDIHSEHCLEGGCMHMGLEASSGVTQQVPETEREEEV